MADELQIATIEITDTHMVTNTPKPFKVITSKSGVEFTCFDAQLSEELYKGRTISIGYVEQQKGNKTYRNIRQLGEPSGTEEHIPKETLVNANYGERATNRRTALITAKDWATSYAFTDQFYDKGTKKFNLSLMLKMADEFEKWLNKEA